MKDVSLHRGYGICFLVPTQASPKTVGQNWGGGILWLNLYTTCYFRPRILVGGQDALLLHRVTQKLRIFSGSGLDCALGDRFVEDGWRALLVESLQHTATLVYLPFNSTILIPRPELKSNQATIFAKKKFCYYLILYTKQ